jgi:hypothetical protein
VTSLSKRQLAPRALSIAVAMAARLGSSGRLAGGGVSLICTQ